MSARIKITFSLLFAFQIFFVFYAGAQNANITKIYAETSRYNPDFCFDGKLLYKGSNAASSSKNFYWYDKKVYDGRSVGCAVAYHMNGDGFYKGKASFDDDLMYKIDGQKAYVKKTNDIAFTHDGQTLYEKDSSRTLLRADKRDTVPFQMMIAAYLSMQW
jgi:hypothetical protein